MLEVDLCPLPTILLLIAPETCACPPHKTHNNYTAAAWHKAPSVSLKKIHLKKMTIKWSLKMTFQNKMMRLTSVKLTIIICSLLTQTTLLSKSSKAKHHFSNSSLIQWTKVWQHRPKMKSAKICVFLKAMKASCSRARLWIADSQSLRQFKPILRMRQLDLRLMDQATESYLFHKLWTTHKRGNKKLIIKIRWIWSYLGLKERT